MAIYRFGDHDDDITAAETPGAIAKRIAEHMRGVATSIDNAVGLLDSLGGSEREYLAFALAAQAEELADAARDLGPALRSLAR
jgi:hypothetical protein